MPEFKTKLVYLCRLCGVRDDSFTITQTAKDLEYCGLRTHTRDTDSVTVLPSLIRVPVKRVHQCTQWMSGIADLFGAETVNPVDGNESAGENLKAGFHKKAEATDAAQKEITEHIQKGFEQAERGELLTPSEAKLAMRLNKYLSQDVLSVVEPRTKVKWIMTNIVKPAYEAGLQETKELAAAYGDPTDRL